MLLRPGPILVTPNVAAGNDPKSLVLDVATANIRGQFGKVWPRLHPRYRAVTTCSFWESCQRKKGNAVAGTEFLSLKGTETYPDTITLPLLGRTRVMA